MSDNYFIFLYKMRFLFGSLLIIACLFLLSFILSFTTSDYKVHAANAPTDSSYASTADDPNIISVFMTESGNQVMQITSSSQNTINSSLHDITSSIATVPVHGAKVIAGGIYSGTAFAVHSASSAFGFVAHAPAKIADLASPSNIASETIRPADNVPLQKIDAPPQSDIPAKAVTAAAPTNPQPTPPTAPAPSTNANVQWPLHGAITTLFGVPEPPYQAIHTGLDISDGRYSGATPVKPFKPGRVAQVIPSRVGLGNHVVIDHGGGLTSVYGHLYSISVQEGQTVDNNTVIGYEGSTGASTGTHLHFEIRINGQPVNPLLYIPGRP
jgi:murein DD-endopeptidase MepM/ murein hydrolase activator NlpD